MPFFPRATSKGAPMRAGSGRRTAGLATVMCVRMLLMVYMLPNERYDRI